MRPNEDAAGSARSLRSRWHRAFAVLCAVVIVGALANFAGTRVLVGAYQGTADWVDDDATLLARLRADISAHSSLVHTAMDGDAAAQQRVAASAGSVQAAFERGLTESHAAEGRRRLQEAFGQWQAVMSAASPLDPSAPVAERLLEHRSLVDGTDGVSVLLDDAAAASRAAGRAFQARAASVERVAMATKGIFVVLMTALMLHLSRRLSAEVLQPVALLRESAHRIGAGEFHHRVEIHRADELGDLAASLVEAGVEAPDAVLAPALGGLHGNVRGRTHRRSRPHTDPRDHSSATRAASSMISRRPRTSNGRGRRRSRSSRTPSNSPAIPVGA